MATKFVSERNLKFLLYEVFDLEALTVHEYFAEHTRKGFDLVLKAAIKVARHLLYPVFTEMDRSQPTLVDGQVRVLPDVCKIMRAFGEGGWLTSTVPFDRDGEQLPLLLAEACRFVFMAANYSATVYAILTSGAADLIATFGSMELYNTFVPNMHAGKWQGTMALTEPEAGSSLSDITTSAEPTGKGHYLIRGQKIFISAGDHDGVENVVHLMLSKIKGGPAGVKGISLFVVPKKRMGADGSLVPNDVKTSGIFHKLGYRGCPIVQLSMGDANDCRGYLVGEPHAGLKYMFQMMNEARIDVGTGAAAMATGAYYASLDYARTRRQGRRVCDKNPTLPPVPIIEHADVKRMLLFQRAITEGSLSLLLQCSFYVDMQKADPDHKEKYHLLLELLTPVAKSYPSEMGIAAISQGLQCLGGSGFCDDYPLEQYYRDARIHPIHEGTTGIQGIDLLGRKVEMLEGRAFQLYLLEVARTISDAGKRPELLPMASQLEEAVERLKSVTASLLNVAEQQGREKFLADATLYLELFGIVAIAWQWLLQGLSIQKGLAEKRSRSEEHFYRGKLATLRFFFEYELPKTLALAKRLRNPDGLTVSMAPDDFKD